jgi:hypothetical protein
MHGHEDLPAIAVIDASDAGIAVWHVDVGAIEALAGGRLTGAWLLSSHQAAELQSVLHGKYWLGTPAGVRAADAVGLTPQRGIVALGATVASVREERTSLLAAFEAEQAQRGRVKQLVDLVLPEVAEPPEKWQPSEGAPEAVAVAHAIARWLEQLARVWEAIESQRLARPFLRDFGGAQQRAMPVKIA